MKNTKGVGQKMFAVEVFPHHRARVDVQKISTGPAEAFITTQRPVVLQSVETDCQRSSLNNQIQPGTSRDCRLMQR